jgi:elongation factor P--(R)-beta-lysine ligase
VTAEFRPIVACDFGPTATWDRLALRAQLLARVRSFFAERAFLEVETPLL